ncbi:tRNA-intron lyase [Candidatus Micrarchaeota archaeon]|nr:MAG: tRNA-intron lyase [Candidatus Micrarchaeota archaeon]
MALLLNNQVWMTEDEKALIEDLLRRGYGEKISNRLLLMPEEALFLMEKRKSFTVSTERGKKKSFDELYKLFTRLDKLFPLKYNVFRDLRERGYCVKTGFKFGSHYRVYARGKKPGSGHADWLVQAIPENRIFEANQLSVAVRLAQNVRKKMIYAVVDKEGDIVYYKVERITP